ncbi:exoribonuclease-2 [Formivibrio citricus]|uniref:Exoribonuclease-2 n=1 Tax=Formivibrio citricus TaxID=83765 RepID=A0A1I5DLH1_9NEIS|nr:RNB domain-containing ribonuclease [Formivibrio citricus]SFO00094.1 exoribonuclease-2 [Formivibrio citricus]
MNVFYEEDGSFKVASVREEQQASLMVEDARGKRGKIKSASVLLKFDRVGLEDFLHAAEAAAAEIDLDFLWECCGPDEFGFQDIAAEYFGAGATPAQQAAVAIRLHAAPMYFYRKGKGRYKAAPEENLKAALAGQERKRIEAEQMAAWQDELRANKLPAAFSAKLNMLLHRPDKNSIEWKALAAASDAEQMSPLRLLERAGAIPDVAAYFMQGFLTEYFPKGRGFAPVEAVAAPDELPLADVQAFSIDDAQTTEIDDAFSLVRLPNGNWRVGIHIAAPTLGIAPGSELDKIILERLSTVYMPGDKITMLPDEVVEVYTLKAGEAQPAVSMYLEVSQGFDILSRESKVERVRLAANLRHDQIEPYFNEETAGKADAPDYPWKDELTWLWHFANALEARRGKAEANGANKVDYGFRIHRDGDEERVEIFTRKRGSPMDKLVAELMILVNSQWGKDLASASVACIYRAQGGGRVRMTTQPSPHIGLGVECYAWSSSPLRRAVDFINQQQLVAMLAGQKPRFQRNDAELFSIIGSFDAAYAAYADFQDKMERYWCLRYLEQENIQEMSATVLKENLVRIDGMPLVLRVGGLPELPGGSTVKLQRLGMDYLELNVDCRIATL